MNQPPAQTVKPCFATGSLFYVKMEAIPQNQRDEGEVCPTHIRQIDWRAALMGGLAFAIGIAAVACLWYMAFPLAILVLSITIADAVAPIVEILQRWRLTRSQAAVLTYVVFLGSMAAIFWYLIPHLTDQVQELWARVPQVTEPIAQILKQWDATAQGEITKALQALTTHIGQYVVSVPVQIASGLIEVVIIIFLSFYWLLWAPELSELFRSLLPLSWQPKYRAVTSDMSHTMGGYIRGSVIDAIIVGTLAALGLWAVGINYPIVLGILTALGEFIPYLGPTLAAIPAVAVGLLQSPTKAFIALLVYVAVQQIEGHLLTPNIMRSQTNLPQSLVIFALLAGGSIGGILGAIVAIPIASALRVLTLRIIVPAVRRRNEALASTPR